MKNFMKTVENKNVIAYDIEELELPLMLTYKKQGNIEVCLNNDPTNNSLLVANRYKKYTRLSDIRARSGNVAFLGGHSKLGCLFSYPYSCEYVCIAVEYDKYTLIALLGLLRRLIYGRTRNNSKISLVGVKRMICLNGREKKWLVLENSNAAIPTNFSLSKKIGLNGLLEFLNSNHVRYTFLRFFEKLPELHREGGDLDILVSDEHHGLIISFLLNNPGDIPVDIYSVSGPAYQSMIPYYPPFLAEEMLANSVNDANGFRILDVYHYALSFLYHIVYHKGATSGVKTKIEMHEHYVEPDNDYLYYANKLLSSAGLPNIVTLDDAEKLLEEHGWKPKLDTLHFLSRTNEYVRKKYFSQVRSDNGLGVFILKRGFFKKNTLDKFSTEITKKKYIVLDSFHVDEDMREIILKDLRGGNWKEAAGDPLDYIPEAIVVVINKKSTIKSGLRKLKTHLRKKFDRESNFIHGTDNSFFSEEYIETIYYKGIPKDIINSFSKNDHNKSKIVSYLMKKTSALRSILFIFIQSYLKNKFMLKNK